MFSSDLSNVKVLRIPIKVVDDVSFARRMARRRKSETMPEYDFHAHNKRVRRPMKQRSMTRVLDGLLRSEVVRSKEQKAR